MENLFNLLFPPKCLICSKVNNLICRSCLSKAEVLESDFCLICDNPSAHGFTHKTCLKPFSPCRFISVFEYEGVVRNIIKKSKYGRMSFYALKLLTEFGLRLLLDDTLNNLKNEIDLVVSVPLSSKKTLLRGFNQADVIAQHVCKYINKKFIQKMLLRKKQTESQFKFNRNTRFENVKDAFEINKDKLVFNKKPYLMGKNILLVDDISTSGATLLACSKKLLEAGANSVICFTLSKRLKK